MAKKSKYQIAQEENRKQELAVLREKASKLQYDLGRLAGELKAVSDRITELGG